VWLASLGAGRAGEPGKNRPVIVVSADALRASSPADLFVIVPLSRSLTSSFLRPSVTPEEGVDAPSAAVCRAIRGVSPSRLLRPLGRVRSETLGAIEHAVSMLLGLD
jgi:mRNA interferase MazF